MAYTLSNLLQDVFSKLGKLNVSLATGGSDTTIIDTKLIDLGADDEWKDGIAFVIRDSAGANGAPEGEFNRISGYKNATGVFTVDTAFTTASGSGDTYGYVNSELELQQAIMLANEGLQLLGDIPRIDTTTLDTANNQTEYAMAVAWKRRPFRVDIQGRTDDANDNRWVTAYNWEYIVAAPGSTGLIVFDMQHVSSRDIRVWYMDSHPLLNAYSDVVYEPIQPELAAHAAYLTTLRYMNGLRRGKDDYLREQLNKAEVELDRLMAKFTVEKPGVKPKYKFTNLRDEIVDRWKPVADI